MVGVGFGWIEIRYNGPVGCLMFTINTFVYGDFNTNDDLGHNLLHAFKIHKFLHWLGGGYCDNVNTIYYCLLIR